MNIVDDVGEPGWYTSLVPGADGSPHLSYQDRAGFDLKYALREASSCQAETVDSEGDVGAFASLVLDRSGRPRISYYDRTKGDLKYAFKDCVVGSAGWLGESWDAGVDVWPSPTPEQPRPGCQGYVGLGCIYVGDTVVLDGEMKEVPTIPVPDLSRSACSLLPARVVTI